MSPRGGERVGVSGGIAGTSGGGLWRPGRLAAVELPRQPGPTLGQLFPIVRHPGLLWIAIPQHDGQLARGQARAGILRLGPPAKASLREPFSTEPEALAIVAQDFQCGARAVPEDVERTAEGIVAEGAAADGGESIDAFAEVDGLCGDKDATLRRELEHQGVSKKARTNATSGGCGSWGSGSAAGCHRPGRVRSPSLRWGLGHTGVAITSTKPRVVDTGGRSCGVGWAAQRFFNSPPLTRNRVATRVIANIVVKAMACSHRCWGIGSAACGTCLAPLLKTVSHIGELVFSLGRGDRLHRCLQVRGCTLGIL